MLIAFSVISMAYTGAMRGYTLGRRLAKIKLVRKVIFKITDEEISDEDKAKALRVNPIIAMCHDAILKYLYFLVIGLYSLIIAAIVLLALAVIDVVMASLKSHRIIRDYLTLTEEIEVSSY